MTRRISETRREYIERLSAESERQERLRFQSFLDADRPGGLTAFKQSREYKIIHGLLKEDQDA